jgi:hypothetical protein
LLTVVHLLYGTVAFSSIQFIGEIVIYIPSWCLGFYF